MLNYVQYSINLWFSLTPPSLNPSYFCPKPTGFSSDPRLSYITLLCWISCFLDLITFSFLVSSLIKRSLSSRKHIQEKLGEYQNKKILLGCACDILSTLACCWFVFLQHRTLDGPIQTGELFISVMENFLNIFIIIFFISSFSAILRNCY